MNTVPRKIYLDVIEKLGRKIGTSLRQKKVIAEDKQKWKRFVCPFLTWAARQVT